VKFLQNLAAHWKDNVLLRRILRNSGYLFSSNTVTMGLSMVQSILAARLLGVAGFGVLGAIVTFTTVVNKFTSFRMGELVIKFVGHHHEAHDRDRSAAIFRLALLTEVCASLLAFGLLCLLAPLGARYFSKDETLAPWFIVYGLTVLANLVAESSTGLLQLFDRFRRMAFLSILQALVTLAFILAAYWMETGLLGILVAYLAGKVTNALGLTVAALREAKRRWGSGWLRVPLAAVRSERRDLLNFAVSTNLSSSLSLVNKDSELLWVSFFCTPVQTGYYKLALALANLVQIPVAPLPQATYPELSRAVARKGWQDIRYILRQGSLLAGGFTLAAAVGLAVLGRPLISLFYGAEFLPGYPGLLALLAGYLVANTFYWARTALLSLNLPHIATRINLLVTTLKVAGVVILLPLIGYLGSAVMLAAGYFVGIGLSVMAVFRRIGRLESLEAQP